jgi:hypothetical protein
MAAVSRNSFKIIEHFARDFGQIMIGILTWQAVFETDQPVFIWVHSSLWGAPFFSSDRLWRHSEAEPVSRSGKSAF